MTTSHDEEEEWEEARLVRPYAVTGGRTRATGNADFPMEALVCPTTGTMVPTAGTGVAVERQRIRQLCEQQLLSIAELSAMLHVPLGVIRVLVSDLVNEGLVTVSVSTSETVAAATNLYLLESVLNGIATL